MAKLVNVKDRVGQFRLVRQGRDNTRVRPLDGGEDFLVPTSQVEFLETDAPDVPRAVKVEKEPTVVAPVEVVTTPVEVVAPVVIQTFELPTSTAPHWVLHYTREKITLHEFQTMDQAVGFLGPLFNQVGVQKFGNATFKVDQNSLYELHNLELTNLQEQLA